MDTTPTRPSIIDWLESHGLPGLPEEYLCTTTARGAVAYHHPDGCIYATEDGAPAYTEGPRLQLCGCVVKDTVGGERATEFFRIVRALIKVEFLLDRALDGAGYDVRGEFPQLTALAVRHHRYYAERQSSWPALLAATPLFTELPAAEALRLRVAAAWNAVEAEHPLDRDALRSETIRYSVRRSLSTAVHRSAIHMGLAVHNSLQQLAWDWLSKPVNGTLLEEYYSEAGDELRTLVVDAVKGSGFTLGLIDELDRIAAELLARDTPTACHVGSPDMNVFEEERDARSLLIWSGLKARAGSVALAEYPAIVAEVLAGEQKRERLRLHTSLSGGLISVICDDPGLEPHQWEIALTLWEDSFENDETNPGPYRDQRTAILAAAEL